MRQRTFTPEKAGEFAKGCRSLFVRLAIVVFAAVGGAGLSTFADAFDLGDPFDITTGHRDHHAPQVATDGANNWGTVWASQQGFISRIYVSRSADDGRRASPASRR
jgi:hypothetical protein